MAYLHLHINKWLFVSAALACWPACKKQSSSTTGSAYAVDPSNFSVPNDLQACTKKGPPYVFKNGVCYNPTIVAQQQATCAQDATQTWNTATMTCVPLLQFESTNCLEQGIGYVWGNQDCYSPTEEQPTACKDLTQDWDGNTCVASNTTPNYYRFCISHSLATDARTTVQILEKTVAATTCQASFSSLYTLRTLDLSNQNITNIIPLVGFSALTTLNLSSNQITNGAALTYLFNLTNLNISNNQLPSFQFLEELPLLQTLRVQNNPASDYQYLFGLSHLTFVDITAKAVSSTLCTPGITAPAFISICSD